jgi:hypothetical protein
VHTAPDAATALPDQGLLYLGIHRDGVEVSAQRETTLFLLGGEPFESDIVMWWNFVGRSHDEIVAAREAWRAKRTTPSAPTRGSGTSSDTTVSGCRRLRFRRCD